MAIHHLSFKGNLSESIDCLFSLTMLLRKTAKEFVNNDP